MDGRLKVIYLRVIAKSGKSKLSSERVLPMENSRELRAVLSMIVAATSAVMFAASLANEEFYFGQADPHWNGAVGHDPHFYGRLEISVGLFHWVANPFLVASWLMIVNRRSRDFAWLAAFIALAIALSFMAFFEVPIGAVTNPRYGISHFSPGYGLWITSIAIMLAGSLTVLLLTYEAQLRNPRGKFKGRTG